MLSVVLLALVIASFVLVFETTKIRPAVIIPDDIAKETRYFLSFDDVFPAGR